MWAFAADLAVVVLAYAAAWALRFAGDFQTVLPLFVRDWPTVIGAQVAALIVLRAHRPGPTIATVRRFVVAVSGGAALAAAWLYTVQGRGAVSLSAVGADVVLACIGGALWRCVQTFWRLDRAARAEAALAPAGMDLVSGRHALGIGVRDLVRYRYLAGNLVRRDLKLKYRGSALGFLWSLVNPLIMVTVYTFAFTHILQVRQPGFVFNLLVGLLAWAFFANSSMMATSTIVESGGLLKSIYFPRAILPVSSVLFNLSQYLLTLAVFLPILCVIYRIVPGVSLLAFPLVLALQVVFTIGVSFALSATTAIYRDVKHLTEVALSVLFWLTPLMYSVDGPNFPVAARTLVELSPMTPFITAYRAILHEGRWPTSTTMLVAVLYATTALVVGATLFSSLEERFAERI